MIYDIEIIAREAARRRIRADSQQCKITEYASNDWTYSFNDGMGWERPLLRVTRADHTIRVIVQAHRGPWHCDIYFNGVRILDTVGGLENRNVGSQVDFNVESGVPKVTLPILETLKTFEGEGDRWVTYYAPGGGSFGTVSMYHMRWLPSAGWNVKHASLEDLVKRGVAASNDEWGLIHPTLYVFSVTRSVVPALRRRHTHVGGFDVADTDHISPSACMRLNKVNLLMVPSRCSRNAYVNSGVKSRVETVHHGVDENLFSAPRSRLPEVPSGGVKILYFFLHSPLRKGSDVVQKVMSRILREKPETRFVLKTVGNNELCLLPKTKVINHWLSEFDLVRLYDSCDILLAPSRGGSFELNVLEGLARGLVVITSDWGAIQEYAAPYALTIKSTGNRVKPLPGNALHDGYGADPDVDDCYRLVNYALNNMESLKKKAEKNAVEVRRKYSWRNTARRIAECLK